MNQLLPSIFELNPSAWQHDQDAWRNPKAKNMATEIIPTLSFRLESDFIIVEDQNEIKCHVDQNEFINWVTKTKKIPYTVSGMYTFIQMTPSWKIVDLVIEFDNTRQ